MNRPQVPALPRLSLGTAMVLLALTGHAHTEREGYTQFLDAADTPKMVRDGFSGCVRTGDWSEQKQLSECAGAAMADKPKMASNKDKMTDRNPVVPPPPSTVAPPPAPEPMPAEVKPLPATPRADAAPMTAAPKADPDIDKITLGAEALFASGQSALKPGAKGQLDDVAAKLSARPVSGITITGHTDRTGPDALNRKLSQQRANAVKAYLVSKGIPAAKITAEGKASTEPRTSATDCGTLKGKALAACLQPDRRVEVTVVH